MELRIENAQRGELEQIEALERACFSRPWTQQQLESQLPDEHHVFLVALEGETVLGYVGMMTVLDEGYIGNVAVSPTARRRGIADALIDELLARAETAELAFVTLEVRESNAPAIALYAKHGFEPVGKRKNYYDFPTEDAILMTKFLK